MTAEPAAEKQPCHHGTKIEAYLFGRISSGQHFFGRPDQVFELDESNGAVFVLQITAKTGARL